MPYLKESWQAEHGYAWTHAVLGEKSKIVEDYSVPYFPTSWLVLPDGTLAPARVDGLPDQIAHHRRQTPATPAR